MAQNLPRQLPPNAPSTGAKVLSQTPQLGTNAAGRAVQGVMVVFQLPSGTQGNVFIPDSDYSIANVQAAIQQRAYAMKQVEEGTY